MFISRQKRLYNSISRVLNFISMAAIAIVSVVVFIFMLIAC